MNDETQLWAFFFEIPTATESKRGLSINRERELQAELAMGLVNGGSGREVVLDVGSIEVQLGARRIQLPSSVHRREPLLPILLLPTQLRPG